MINNHQITCSGQKKTLVKVLKAKSADFEAVQVSDDDRTQIMFADIMKQISDIRKELIKTSNNIDLEQQKYIDWNNYYSNISLNNDRHMDLKRNLYEALSKKI